MKVLAVIPARGGSKGVKKKNLLKINNKSLVNISISQAKASKYISKIVLSSDSSSILKEGIKAGCKYCIRRPKNLSGDKDSIFKVIKHSTDWFWQNHSWTPDIIALILPTTPLRPLWHIDECLKKLIKTKSESIMTIKSPEYPPYWMFKINNKKKLINLIKKGNKFLRRQDTPKVYQPAGTFWGFKYGILDKMIKNKITFPTKNTVGVIVQEEESINIDEYRNYQLAKVLFKSKKNV